MKADVPKLVAVLIERSSCPDAESQTLIASLTVTTRPSGVNPMKETPAIAEVIDP